MRDFEDKVAWPDCVEGQRPVRPGRLNEKQPGGINLALRQMPREVGGMGRESADGKTLAAWIHKQYGINLGVRQCQRLFRQLGFRLRKPRPSNRPSGPCSAAGP